MIVLRSILAVFLLVAAGLILGGLGDTLDAPLHDLAATNPQADWPEDLLLVVIDDQSKQAFGHRWSRARLATLFSRLRELGAKTIATSVFPEEPGEPAEDARFARSLRNTVQGAHIRQASGAGDSLPFLMDTVADIQVSAGAVRLPLSARDPNWPLPAGVGISSIHRPETMAPLRRYAPLVGVSGTGRSMPSLALAALLEHRGWSSQDVEVSARGIRLPGRKRISLAAGKLSLTFPASMPPRLSATETLRGEDDALRTHIAGKLVLVYMANPVIPIPNGIRARKYTDEGFIHAAAIKNLDNPDGPVHVPKALAWAAALLQLLLLLGARDRRRAYRVVLSVAAVAGSLSVALVLALQHGILVPVAGPMVALVATVIATLLVGRRPSARPEWAPPPASGAGAPTGVVTFVFTDVQGSTPLWEACPKGMRAALQLHDQIIRHHIQLHGLYEIKTEGDAFMIGAADSAAAVRFCADVQTALHDAEWPNELAGQPDAAPQHQEGSIAIRGLRVRMGVHRGSAEAVPDPFTGRMDYLGPTVNRAARITSQACGGQVLISPDVWNDAGLRKSGLTVRHLGSFTLRGITGRQPLLELVPAELDLRAFDPSATITGAVETPPTLKIGTIVAGRYKLIQLLGGGGQANVYRAVDRELGEQVALKVLRAGQDQGRIEKVKDEVRVARRVTTSSVIRFHDFGRDGDIAFITMELAGSETLMDRIQSGVNWREGLQLGTAIADALAEIHDAGVIHRDVKPQNVLFTDDGAIKLGDFGISQIGDGSGDRVGTPQYMSPEQIAGKDQSPASDVYSLGIVLYQLLSGQTPFEGSVTEVTRGHLVRPPGRLEDCNPKIPRRIARLVDAALEKDPRRRPQCARSVASLLREAANEGMTSPVRPDPGPKTAQ